MYVPLPEMRTTIRPLTTGSSRQGLHELSDRSRVTVGDAAVPSLEQLEGVVDAERLELLRESSGPEVEVVLVGLPGIEVDPLHALERVGMLRRHAHRVPREPLCPHLVDQPSGLDVERKSSFAGSGL